MKNFYVIQGGIPCKETKNVYPQVLRPTAPKGSSIYEAISGLRNRPDRQSNGLVIELELDPKTNPTDFISQSWIGGTGLLISPVVYEFFLKFNLQPEMEVYKTIIHHKGKDLEYVWLFPSRDYKGAIDFKSTKFFLFDVLTDSKQPIEILDEKDFRSKRFKNHPLLVTTDNLILADKNSLNFDLMLISIGSFNVRISEHLKDELEKTKFSAFQFGGPILFS